MFGSASATGILLFMLYAFFQHVIYVKEISIGELQSTLYSQRVSVLFYRYSIKHSE